MMYEPGCMDEGMKGPRGIAGDIYIDPKEPGKMISKIDWMQLDDGDEGIAVDRVDWTGCEFFIKQALIESYNMRYINGYQPEPPREITNDKFVCIRDGEAKLTNVEWLTRGRWLLWYLIVFPISFVVFSYFAVDPFDRLGQLFIAVGVVNIFSTWIVSGLWCLFIEMPWRMRRQQKLYDQGKIEADLNNFIKECRK